MGFFIIGAIAIIVFFLIGFTMVKSGDRAENLRDRRELENARKSYLEHIHKDEKPKD